MSLKESFDSCPFCKRHLHIRFLLTLCLGTHPSCRRFPLVFPKRFLIRYDWCLKLRIEQDLIFFLFYCSSSSPILYLFRSEESRVGKEFSFCFLMSLENARLCILC